MAWRAPASDKNGHVRPRTTTKPQLGVLLDRTAMGTAFGGITAWRGMSLTVLFPPQSMEAINTTRDDCQIMHANQITQNAKR
ncbi:hypothetical protein PABG_07454 [Paracoccidioides brasiliensis Pb03]|nr:hypothetical protein PABG_07454 [Paracoccidioides brasiliensis Pb03]